ncbi:1-phosphatidylinositol 4,5-bisphosphate phosphodiesterase eta-1 isoform X2 [Amia ocellicauda]|uniref:1-phosphatidylinositol 4,5-bisphosphate phosphodiesterase eta-1 isoform X2 n=1 Tax=Amia ocellicauda TaxID=2972642 RepID=UPI00346420B9
MSSWGVDSHGCLQYSRHFLSDNSVFLVERCMSVMQSGTQMIKLKNGSKGLVRLFYLDEHRSCLRWRPSRKSEKAKITIDSLYKVTEGRQSEIFHRHADGNFNPSCCFTIYHGNHMESLDLVTSNPEEARTWITGLKYLMAGISDEDSLAKRQRTHDQWMKQTFEEADKNGDGLLNIEEIYQLLHKMNVNLPRRKVRQMFQEADTDEQQGTLTYEEFSVFYKMMSLRRDLFLLLMCFSDKKDHLTVEELAHFLRTEQKMNNVTTEYCLDIIDKFEVSEENKEQDVLGIDGFTSFMRSPACDVFNPLHQEVNQDMDQPLCNYFIASSHNTYLTGDQLLSQSKTDMYTWVLQAGCRCVEVDCWDGPDGEPMVQHGYTLTSKISFKAVIETINKHAFVKNEYPVILSIENHCSIQQQKKIAQYLKEIFGEKLDLGRVLTRDSKELPSPNNLKGKILIKGKRLPPYLAADAEEGEVSDDDSADEIEDDFKLKHSSSNGKSDHQVESFIRKKLDSLLKESQIGDKEDSDSFSIRALLRATHEGLNVNLKPNSCLKESGKKSQSRSFISFSKHKKHGKSRAKSQSTDIEEEGQHEASGKDAGQSYRAGRRRKTMKLSRDLSDVVVFTNSVASQDILDEGTPGNVLSFSEIRAHQLVHHKPEQFILFNQKQLSRIYPSAYRIDSSNFNPQAYWNVGCQLVALNYQTEGRMMQLNRAKFMVNGNSGYVLKPQPMNKGSFNPFSDDPLPAYPKKQLVLKIISGQQLPKPPDSMLGDRGEIIDPYVEVEIIGLPVDCCKEQTRVVDDNGFNPVWEETLTFTLHMPELALVRFLVWDHDPIGRDFVGQRTVAFCSLMPGYRHVYLEGMTESSIFIQVMVNDIYGKWSPLILNPSYTIMHFLGASKGRQLRGIKGLFNKNPKNGSVDTNSGFQIRKRSISDHILRRTASAPAKGRKKTKMGFAEPQCERKDSEPELESKNAMESHRPKSSLHRPVSMPLEKLLTGVLELPTNETEKVSEDNDTHSGNLSSETGRLCSVERLRSVSVDLLFETYPSLQSEDRMLSSKAPWESSLRVPVKTSEMEKVSYLEIGGKSSEECFDAPPPNEENVSFDEEVFNDDSSCKKTIWSQPNIPETTPEHLVSTKDGPEDHSSEHIQAELLRKRGAILNHITNVPLCSVSSVDVSSILCMEKSELQSPYKSMQESTISRLIDNVSLDNENDTCGSISALIGQFDTTHDQSNLTVVSSIQGTNNHTFSIMSGFSSTLIWEPNTPQKPCLPSKTSKDAFLDATSDTAVFSSPETTDQSVYTILNEDFLSPTSVYNLRDQTIRSMQINSEENTPVGSSCTTPLKSFSPRLRSDERAGWGPQGICSSTDRTTSDKFLVFPDSASSSLMEVEVNVDDDSQDITLTSTCANNQWTSQSPSPCSDSPHDWPLNNSMYHNSYHVPDIRPENIYRNHDVYRGLQDQSYTLQGNYQLSESIRTKRINRFQGDYHLSKHFDPRKTHSVFERNDYTPNSDCNVPNNCIDYNGLAAPNARCQGLPLPNRPARHLYTHPEQAPPAVHVAKHPSPGKSKSLGDLTSEDISCNFESKYKYISRSFITPNMRERKRMSSLTNRPQSADPLTEQLRRLVSFEPDECSQPGPVSPLRQDDDSPKILSRKLSSRSQSRVRHIANRAKERQEASKQKVPDSCSTAGVVLRNKPSAQNPTVNRHSTGSYIAGYLNHINGAGMEDRGLPEGACTSLHYNYNDHFYTDDSVLQTDSGPRSEPEIYFLLRL